jgi:hypothetical protein
MFDKLLVTLYIAQDYKTKRSPQAQVQAQAQAP